MDEIKSIAYHFLFDSVDRTIETLLFITVIHFMVRALSLLLRFHLAIVFISKINTRNILIVSKKIPVRLSCAGELCQAHANSFIQVCATYAS